jgi:hypothetical protein
VRDTQRSCVHSVRRDARICDIQNFEENKRIESESTNRSDRSELLCLIVWYLIIVLVLSNNLVNYSNILLLLIHPLL